MWERSVRQESYDFCGSPSLLSFSHFAPELVGKIFGLFLSQKPSWNFSYEPKAKLVLVTGLIWRLALKCIRTKYIKRYHHYQYQIKGWPNKTINKTYWERLFTLTDMLLYLTPRHVTGTSSKSTFLSTYKSTRAAAVTLPYSGALDFLPGTSPESWLCHKRHNAWDIVRLLRLKHSVTNLSESKISRKFRAISGE